MLYVDTATHLHWAISERISLLFIYIYTLEIPADSVLKEHYILSLCYLSQWWWNGSIKRAELTSSDTSSLKPDNMNRENTALFKY